MKDVRLRSACADHDRATKERAVRKFLDKGYRVRVTVVMKGRERSRLEVAVEACSAFCDAVSDVARVEGSARVGVGQVSMVLRAR